MIIHIKSNCNEWTRYCSTEDILEPQTSHIETVILLSVSLVTLVSLCVCNKLRRLYPYVGFTNDFSKPVTLIYYSMDLLCSNYPGAKPRFSSLDNGTNFSLKNWK